RSSVSLSLPLLHCVSKLPCGEASSITWPSLYLAEPVQLKPIACCFKYTLRKIPIRFVADYSRTHKQCSSPGIIFHTRRGRQICANPSDAWVQEYISNLDNSKGANMA
uniref:C-C motif chemokine n=1 Tax=Felis catus TaxID=9685 RepID=A0ABI7XPZ2_FELCA